MGKKKKRAFPEEAQAEKPAGRKKQAALSSGAGGAPFWACRLYRTPVTAQSH